MAEEEHVVLLLPVERSVEEDEKILLPSERPSGPLRHQAPPSSPSTGYFSSPHAKRLVPPEPPHGGGNSSTNLQQHYVSSPATPYESASSDGSLKVMCIQIAHMSRTGQLLVMTMGIFSFLLIYGFLQEYIVIHVFNRRMGIFLTLCQFLGYSFFALLHRIAHAEMPRRIPLRYYLLLATLQAAMQGLTNLSMQWLNYPAKMLFKSSRIIPTMLVGVLYMKKRYKPKDYLVVVLMSLGLVLFMQADVKTSPSFHPLGIITISMALAVDAAIVNLQEYTLRKYDASHDELVLYSYGLGSSVLLVSSLISGEFQEGIGFLHRNSGYVTCLLIVFCTCGYLGVTCVAALTKKFGALASTMTTTARKALTLFLSFFIFPKPATLMHVVGGVLFVAGLSAKTVPSATLARIYQDCCRVVAQQRQWSRGRGRKGSACGAKPAGDEEEGDAEPLMTI